jgi:hypothetical protein
MTGEHIEAILKQASAKADKDGFLTVPEGGLMTLYVSSQGASLTVSRVEGVRIDGDIVYARTSKKEMFAVIRTDVFAVAVEGASGQPVRRAGFS